MERDNIRRFKCLKTTTTTTRKDRERQTESGHARLQTVNAIQLVQYCCLCKDNMNTSQYLHKQDFDLFAEPR